MHAGFWVYNIAQSADSASVPDEYVAGQVEVWKLFLVKTIIKQAQSSFTLKMSSK